VLIYFDQATKMRVLERLARVLEPDSYLILGDAETIIGITDKFHSVAEQRCLRAAPLSRRHGAEARGALAATVERG
jgi:chemotaxis protein methyltransferase CheR